MTSLEIVQRLETLIAGSQGLPDRIAAAEAAIVSAIASRDAIEGEADEIRTLIEALRGIYGVGIVTPPPSAGWINAAPVDIAFHADGTADWSRPLGVSTWQEGKLANGTWRRDHVVIGANDIKLIVDGAGSGQLQHSGVKRMKGKHGVRINTGELRPGIVSAPLWTYTGWAEGGDGQGRFEFDFEFVGKLGLEMNYHDGIRPGKRFHFLPGDWSNKDVQLLIDFDLAAGTCHMEVDGTTVHTLTKAEVESFGMKWPTKPMFIIHDAWAVNNPAWTGGAFDPNAPAYVCTLKNRLLA